MRELWDEDGGRTAQHIGSLAVQHSGTRARRALRESREEIREDSHGDKWHNRYSALIAWAHMRHVTRAANFLFFNHFFEFFSQMSLEVRFQNLDP